MCLSSRRNRDQTAWTEQLGITVSDPVKFRRAAAEPARRDVVGASDVAVGDRLPGDLADVHPMLKPSTLVSAASMSLDLSSSPLRPCTSAITLRRLWRSSSYERIQDKTSSWPTLEGAAVTERVLGSWSSEARQRGDAHISAFRGVRRMSVPIAGGSLGDRERAADRRRRARGTYNGSELRLQGVNLGRKLDQANSSARLPTMAAIVSASSGVNRPAPTSSAGRCAHVLSSAPHVGSICFFRSNQLLTFAKIGLSATEAALDARD